MVFLKICWFWSTYSSGVFVSSSWLWLPLFVETVSIASSVYKEAEITLLYKLSYVVYYFRRVFGRMSKNCRNGLPPVVSRSKWCVGSYLYSHVQAIKHSENVNRQQVSAFMRKNKPLPRRGLLLSAGISIGIWDTDPKKFCLTTSQGTHENYKP